LCRSEIRVRGGWTHCGGRRRNRFCRIPAHPFISAFGSRDDPYARRLDVSPCSPRQFRRRQLGKRRPASSTGRPAAIRPSPSASSPRPHRLALARAAVGRLAGQPSHCPACDSPRVAPPRFPALLALEVPTTPTRSPADRPRDPQADSTPAPGRVLSSHTADQGGRRSVTFRRPSVSLTQPFPAAAQARRFGPR